QPQPPQGQIAVVSTEGLISTIAAQRHLDMLARVFSQVIGGNSRGVSKWFIEQCSHLRQQLHGFWGYFKFMMLGVEMARQEAGVWRLVEILMSKSNRKSLDFARYSLTGSSEHTGRINSS